MIFCLVHKMDLIAEEERERVLLSSFDCVWMGPSLLSVPPLKFFSRKRRELEEASAPMTVNCLPTSIWDETLYKVRRSMPTPFGIRLFSQHLLLIRRGLRLSTD